MKETTTSQNITKSIQEAKLNNQGTVVLNNNTTELLFKIQKTLKDINQKIEEKFWIPIESKIDKYAAKMF